MSTGALRPLRQALVCLAIGIAVTGLSLWIGPPVAPIVLWPAHLFGWLGSGHEIGTAGAPFREATPVSVLVGFAGIALCVPLYALLAHLCLSGRWRPRALGRGGRRVHVLSTLEFVLIVIPVSVMTMPVALLGVVMGMDGGSPMLALLGLGGVVGLMALWCATLSRAANRVAYRIPALLCMAGLAAGVATLATVSRLTTHGLPEPLTLWYVWMILGPMLVALHQGVELCRTAVCRPSGRGGAAHSGRVTHLERDER